MGSPLSPVLANLFMEYFESELLPTISPLPKLWVRYVDDIFMLWPLDKNFDDFFAKVNALVPSIKFTTEWEVGSNMPFLDTKVHRQISGFHFGVYRKPTHSNQYIHYFSWQSDNIKKSSIFSLLFRAYRLCDYPHLDREINFLHKAFKRVGFPDHVFEEVHSKVKKRVFSPSATDNDDGEPFSRISLPYSKFVENYITPVLRSNNVQVVHKTSGSIRKRLVRNQPPKQGDKRDMAGVYTIPCRDCDKAYYGETGRRFTDRLREHKNDVERENLTNACYKHVHDTGPQRHAMDWDNARLMWPSGSLNDRLVVESAFICKYPNFNAKNSTLSVDVSSADVILKTIPVFGPP